MTLLDLIYHIRLRLDDEGGSTGAVPAGYIYYWESDDAGCLWKNSELVSYLNSANRELGLREPLVSHHTAEIDVNRVTLASGVAVYSLDPAVLAVDHVVLESTGLPLVKIADAQVRSMYGDPNTPTYKDPSEVQQYRDDLDRHTLTVYATPTATDRLLMTVRHLPLCSFAWASRKSQTSEYSERFDDALIDWACHLALLKRDADTYDADASDKYRGLFTDRVGPRIDFHHARVRQEVAGRRLRTTGYY